jgi:hypothetical protein
VVDDNVLAALNTALQMLEIPKVYTQRAKQVSLNDRSRLFGLRSYTTLEENRATLCRFYVPKIYEAGAMRYVAEATDLYLPGRGSVCAKDVILLRKNQLKFNEKLLAEVCGAGPAGAENYAVLTCVVQRGMASALAAAILEMGLSVPLISFADGMGGRERLGLLRIAIPVAKEVIYFLIPKIDADFLQEIIIRKARLDLPGHGFLYQHHVCAPAVNLRMRSGNRTSAATMEQIITALDQLRGSSEWRRLGARQKRGAREKNAEKEKLTCFSFITDEGQLASYVKLALERGAGGATRLPIMFQSYSPDEQNKIASGAREICDLVIPNVICMDLIKDMEKSNFFQQSSAAMIELTPVLSAVTYAGRGKPAKRLFSLLKKIES